MHGARVVWVHGDRVYIASPDSLALEPGMILTFRDRDKSVATGEITAVHDRELIAAKLTSGSLAKVKHLERLEITARSVIPSLLRIGYPAAGRKSLLFECSTQSPDSSFLLRAYNTQAMDGQAYRLVRNTTYPAPYGWPDSLLVRLFDEGSDEEIALERGELDVGVFWPGEASTHIREVMRWPEHPWGSWGGVSIAASAWRPGVPIDSVTLRADEWRALEQLNQALFRGDLVPWQFGKAPPPPSTVEARFEVDASIPGRDSVERFLNGIMGPGATLGAARVVRIFRVTPKGERMPADLNQTQLLIRCPLISAPRLASYLGAIGPNELANLFRCLPPAKKP